MKVFHLKWGVVLCALVFLHNHSSKAQIFEEAPISIPAGSGGVSGWADLNNDGKPDLVVIAADAQGTYSTTIYQNNGASDFTPSAATLPAVSPVSADKPVQLQFHDLDNDNYIDIFLFGKNASGTLGLTIMKNMDGQSFQEVPHTISLSSRSGFTLGDFDNNGTKELLVTGEASGNGFTTQLYTFKKGIFSAVAFTGIPQTGRSKLYTFDFDQDNRLDVLVLREQPTSWNKVEVYLNKGKYSFSPAGIDLSLEKFHDAALLDYNQDGNYDFVIAGLDTQGQPLVKLYENQAGVFTPTTQDFSATAATSLLAGDVDNDGTMDLLLHGQDKTNGRDTTRFYVWENNTYVPKENILPTLGSGSLSFGDVEEDGSLDVFMNGLDIGVPKSMLWVNKPLVKNDPPGYPGDLFSYLDADTVHLVWSPAYDDHTKPNSLTYAVRIYNTVNDSLLLTSNMVHQARNVVALGVQSTNTHVKLWNLPQGIYGWSVIAIDNSYKGSKVNGGGSGGGGGISCPLSFSVYKADSVKVCKGEMATLNPAVLNGATADWFTSSGGKIGSGSSITFKVERTELMIARVKLPGGCSETFTFPVQALPSPEVNLPENQLVCKNEEVTFSIKDQPGQIIWTSQNQGLLGNTAQITYKTAVADKIWVEVITEEGCSKKDSVSIQLNPDIAFSVGPDVEICPRDQVTIGPGGELNAADYTFEWTPALGLSSTTDRNPVARPLVTTQYKLKATHKISGCTGVDSLVITVKPQRVIDAGADREICKGNSTQLGGAPTASGLDPVYTYEWSPAAGLNNTTVANPIATPAATTEYRVIVKSASCPADTAYVTVTVNIPPPSGAITQYNIFAGEQVTLTATGGAT
ncbi:MAG: FG-GAP repeat domain-containing protein, partial [Rufibacter sp.]